MKFSKMYTILIIHNNILNTKYYVCDNRVNSTYRTQYSLLVVKLITMISI